MDSISVAQRYFEAWNRRDPSLLVANFAEGGTYWDPVAGEVTGQAIGDYATSLFTGFPDLSFEITGPKLVADRTVSAQWVMRGTHNGPYRGMPPSGRPIALQGADFITVDGDKVRSVKAYFDSRAVPEQMGLQVLVQPRTLGPAEFGYSVSVQTGKRNRPGAFAVTFVQARSDQEVEEVRGLCRKTLRELVNMPGFISALTAVVGNRMYTTSAWESPEAIDQLSNGTHKEASDRFFNSNLTAAGAFSVWVPLRISPMKVRCTACARMVDHEKTAGKCSCGETLPAPPPYW